MNVSIDLDDVDWTEVFATIGHDPHEPIKGQTQIANAVVWSDEIPIDDSDEAAEFVTNAVERDGLARPEQGYVIEAYTDQEPAATETTEDETAEAATPDKPADSDELADLKDQVQRLRAQTRRQDQIISLLLGEMSIAEVEPAEMRPLLQRIRTLEERVGELEENAHQQQQVTERTISKPDDRAQRIRQALVDNSDGDGSEVALTREKVNVILGGINRGLVIDAMKRAADGRRAADKDQQYSPIAGTSKLSPVDAIRFEVGEARESQSRVVLETDDLTGSDFRQNLLTEGER